MDQAAPLITEFVDSLARRQWRAAVEHSCGGGLEEGSDFLSMRKFLAELQHVHRGRQLAELMVAIAVGGPWPNRRRFEAGLRDNSKCD
eukprot:8620397-Pyramimonas_sp.AAC.1